MLMRLFDTDRRTEGSQTEGPTDGCATHFQHLYVSFAISLATLPVPASLTLNLLIKSS